MGSETHSRSGLLGDVVLPDRYRVVRRIARGGMGTVWCAEDAALGRRVAIKLLAEQFIDDERAVRRFKREARTAAGLSGHPNVVTIFDVGETAPVGAEPRGRPFIVMENLPGGTVADALRVGAVQREDAMRWIADAAAALDYAHGRGVVHRDIKPGNLLLDGDRTLHVADFGIARIGTDDTLTRTGQLLGTAAYISPEQALGSPATEASDRYSLAVVAFELLAGTRPFSGDHFSLQARQHAENEPPPASSRNSKLPASVDPILARGMAKQPEERWPSASAFAQALQDALREQPTDPLAGSAARVRAAGAAAAATPGAGEWTPRITNRRRRRTAPKRPRRGAAIAAIAASALAVGAAIGASGGTSTKHPRVDAAAGGARHASTIASSPRAGQTGRHTTPHHRPPHASKPPATTTTTPPPTSTEAPTTTGSVASSPTTPPTADALEARGHQLMLDGQYSQAIGVLHQALTAASPGSLTYAYALYDLGRSLRLSGDPRDAVGVLQQRLQIPNQTGVVRQELNLALRALGPGAAAPPGRAGPVSSGGTAPAPPGKAKHGDHGKHGHGGGN